MKYKPMTMADLRAAIAGIPDYAWVCLKDGPLQIVEQELGASEPFVLLSAIQRCLHGVPKDVLCMPCEVVNEDMRRDAPASAGEVQS
jgi:hypothetical protein